MLSCIPDAVVPEFVPPKGNLTFSIKIFIAAMNEGNFKTQDRINNSMQ